VAVQSDAPPRTTKGLLRATYRMNSRAEGSSVSSSIVLLFSSQYVVSNSIIGSGGVEVGSIVAFISTDVFDSAAFVARQILNRKF
jgi:hypothetical protein